MPKQSSRSSIGYEIFGPDPDGSAIELKAGLAIAKNTEI
jgi:hypothetical protein